MSENKNVLHYKCPFHNRAVFSSVINDAINLIQKKKKYINHEINKNREKEFSRHRV